MDADTKYIKMDYYIDLWRGWHTGGFKPSMTSNPGDKIEGTLRVRVSVDLPIIDHADKEIDGKMDVV